MPTYILKCPKCNTEFDFLRLRKSSKAVCPKCGNEKDFEKQPTAPSLSFNGDGWTTTNYVSSVDPTTVPGVKRIDNPTLEQKTLYKTRKRLRGFRKKVRIPGIPEKRRA